MIAIDTNVIVRLLTGDDPAQARAAAMIMRDARFFVSRTVVVEVAWVLDRSYAFERTAIVDALRALLGVENGAFEDRDIVLRGLTWFEAGLDFSDSLHLAASADADTMATFDRRFARIAARLGTTPAVKLVSGGGAGLVSERAGTRRRAAGGGVKKRVTRRPARR